MNQEEIMKILPHRKPMLLVDSAELVGDVVEASYKVRGDEFFLQGHFPDNPIVPGVIQCEIMAQSACVLFEHMGEGVIPVYAGMDKIRFRHMVKPGDEMKIRVRLLRQSHPMYKLSGEIYVGEYLCMSGEFSIVLNKK